MPFGYCSPEMMNDNRYPQVSLGDLSKISYTYREVPAVDGMVSPALIVQCCGTYGVGSPGNGDASFMTAIASAALKAWWPNALIFDMRELDYMWGDRMV